jgi:glycogen debranching enzyme
MSEAVSRVEESVLARCLAAAVANLDLNAVPGRGLGEPSRFLRAGGGYHEPWTRDAAINAWTAASWLLPDVARDTLVMVCQDGPDGPVVAQDDQWWDQVIWVVAAWRHYLLTGDRDFLVWADGVARRSVAILDRDRFDAAYGLYRGPAVMQDGISGYPDSVVDPGVDSSFVLDHPVSRTMFALSTNLVYAAAFDALAAMATELGRDGAYDAKRGVQVRAAVERWFRDGDGYGYLVLPGPDGATLDPSAEALGLAFAVLGGLVEGDRARRIVAGLHREPRGVVSVWPHVQDFGPDRPGRHNAICWPMIMGLWAQADAVAGDVAAFAADLEHLVSLVAESGFEFFEVYHARTGAVDGGWQVGRHWASEPHQTWSATALLGVVLGSVFGIRLTSAGLLLAPMLPDGLGPVRLSGIRYGAALLDIEVTGQGNRLVGIEVDGVALDPGAAVHVPVTVRDESAASGSTIVIRARVA